MVAGRPALSLRRRRLIITKNTRARENSRESIWYAAFVRWNVCGCGAGKGCRYTDAECVWNVGGRLVHTENPPCQRNASDDFPYIMLSGRKIFNFMLKYADMLVSSFPDAMWVCVEICALVEIRTRVHVLAGSRFWSRPTRFQCQVEWHLCGWCFWCTVSLSSFANVTLSACEISETESEVLRFSGTCCRRVSYRM